MPDENANLAVEREIVALIGYGYWGKKIYRYLEQSQNYVVRYVYFRGVKELNKKERTKESGEKFIETYDPILIDASISGVIIATPVDSHFDLSRQALLNNKNVFVEKPLTLFPEQCRELVDIASARGLHLETDYTYTYSRSLNLAAKLIAEDAIGSIESIIVKKNQLGRFLDYDVYTLLGTHCLSILDIFIPILRCEFRPETLIAEGGKATAAIISFQSTKNVCRGYIDISLHCPIAETRVTIVGTTGTLVYTANEQPSLRVFNYPRHQRLADSKVPIENEYSHHFPENDNLAYALDNFSLVLGGMKADNRDRSMAITDILAAFHF
jgi:predicted dehydrogenase